jgi:hypothetical protein
VLAAVREYTDERDAIPWWPPRADWPEFPPSEPLTVTRHDGTKTTFTVRCGEREAVALLLCEEIIVPLNVSGVPGLFAGCNDTWRISCSMAWDLATLLRHEKPERA